MIWYLYPELQQIVGYIIRQQTFFFFFSCTTNSKRSSWRFNFNCCWHIRVTNCRTWHFPSTRNPTHTSTNPHAHNSAQQLFCLVCKFFSVEFQFVETSFFFFETISTQLTQNRWRVILGDHKNKLSYNLQMGDWNRRSIRKIRNW